MLRAMGQTTPSNAASAPVAPSGSPFTYINTSARAQSVIVSGGTVSLIEYSRDGVTFTVVGVLAGLVYLNPGDRIRVTYVTAPTITATPL